MYEGITVKKLYMDVYTEKNVMKNMRVEKMRKKNAAFIMNSFRSGFMCFCFFTTTSVLYFTEK